ncbi:MAG: hypothetical protein LBJ01_07755 [Tannerella sp.]|jgi:hypothetical protein|nr:hypothetical protein [Tannerella sp.]
MGANKRIIEYINDAKVEQNRTGRQAKLDGLPFELNIRSLSEVGKYLRAQDPERQEEYNRKVIDWAKSVSQQLKGNVRSLVKKDVRLSDSIKPHVYYDKKYGREADRIGFTFAREGVYIHRGAGKGQGGFKGGSKWTDKYGKLKETNPLSFYKMGTGNRRPINWFNPVIDRNIEALADIVAEYSADMVVDAERIYIRG